MAARTLTVLDANVLGLAAQEADKGKPRHGDGQMTRVAILMAGGAGRRLWPVSGPDAPKPLFRAPGRSATLLEETLRCVRLAEAAPPTCGATWCEGAPSALDAYVATSAPFAPAIRSAGLVPEDRVLVEPFQRDTSGCVVLGLATLLAADADPARTIVGFLTTDALLEDLEAYSWTIRRAYAAAAEHAKLVCVGVRPTRAETGFGYIEVDEASHWSDLGTRSVRRFREKPKDPAELIASGRSWWNSGLLFGSIASFLRCMERRRAHLADAVRAVGRSLRAGEQASTREALNALPNVSVDYALLEGCDDLLMVAGDFRWDTLDGWDSVYRAAPKDPRGNAVLGDCTVEDCEGCLVYRDAAAGAPPAVAVGLRGMAVVSGAGGLLTARLDEVRQAALRRSGA